MKLNKINCERVTVQEGSLSRLLAKTGQPFAIITAYRDRYPKEENILRNRRLRYVLNNHKLGVHQLIGHWRECQDKTIPYEKCPPDQLKDVVERSYFVQKPDELPFKEFERLITSLGNAFDQDAVILYDGRGVYAVDRTGAASLKGRSVSIGKIAQDYSRHIRKSQVPFVFEGIEVPTSNHGRILWRDSGLVVPEYDQTQRDLIVETLN